MLQPNPDITLLLPISPTSDPARYRSKLEGVDLALLVRVKLASLVAVDSASIVGVKLALQVVVDPALLVGVKLVSQGASW